MNLTEALAVLHRAGKIRTPWLPGSTWTDGVALAWFCLGEGPRPSVGLLMPNVDRWRPQFWDTEHARHQGLELVLTAPGSVGVLAALAREAEGDPGGYAAPVEDADHWEAYAGPHVGLGDTEGEAWAAVIIACAERVRAEQVTP